MPQPWNEKKSKRGRIKRICTQHQFCSNPDCDYYLIADQNIHALVGYGSHGKYENIQDLLCQACHKKFTVRRHTILYCLKTHSKTICLVLNLLALGVDISALEEVLAIRESTLRTWLVRSGVQGRKLHERFFSGLELVHVQLDELWAKVKQAKHDVWVWVACEAKTKIIPVIQLGPRTQDMAYAVVHDKPLYILVGKETFSGGEGFAIDMQARKRGIIIGEQTDGGAHPGASYRLNQHFEAFIPIGCLTHPITKQNWEGSGVTPDIPAPSEQALKIAHKIALESIIETLGNPSSGSLKDLLAEARMAHKELAGE
jgi:hypothetical protein